MAVARKKAGITVNTVELLGLAQMGARFNTHESVVASESIISLVALNLKYSKTVVPQEMMRHYNTLLALTQ